MLDGRVTTPPSWKFICSSHVPHGWPGGSGGCVHVVHGRGPLGWGVVEGGSELSFRRLPHEVQKPFRATVADQHDDNHGQCPDPAEEQSRRMIVEAGDGCLLADP